MLTVVPSIDDSINNSPLWASIIRLTIVNPNPVPDGLVEKKGSVNRGRISGEIAGH